jgi:putative tricarboxylic transport membrane protein
MLVVLNLPMAGLWVRLLYIPQPWLYGGIVLFAVLGVYGINHSVVDVAVLIVIGLLGFVLRRFDYPIAPVVIGLILGPMAEIQFRRALQISQGDFSVFVARPISATLLAIAVLALIGPVILRWARSRRPA